DATAEARSTPCFWRNLTWEAMPPTAGMARLANDIDTCNSVVGQSGRVMGTVPMSEIAYGTFVAIDRTIATTAQSQRAFWIVFQSSSGLPTWLNRAAMPMNVPIAISRLVELTLWSSWR